MMRKEGIEMLLRTDRLFKLFVHIGDCSAYIRDTPVLERGEDLVRFLEFSCVALLGQSVDLPMPEA
jgi:hypothetical protein